MKGTVIIIVLIVLAWAVWHVVQAYRSATGTIWERLYSATKDSATLFWGLMVSWVTIAFNGIMSAGDFFGAPELRDFITKNFSPEWASALILGTVAILTLARLRTIVWK